MARTAHRPAEYHRRSSSSPLPPPPSPPPGGSSPPGAPAFFLPPAAGVVGDCSCCTDDGQCKELFESWSESRNTGEGKNEKSQTRPCVCTEDGPDCAPYLDTESCYKWVPDDGEEGTDEDQAKADRDENIRQLEKYQSDEPQLKAAWDEAIYNADLACQGTDPESSGACAAAEAQEAAAKTNYENNLYYQSELEKQLRETVYRPKQYKQVRTCECCIDGECRELDECFFGTCYLCLTDTTNYNKYWSAMLYTNVLQNEVCTGCTHFNGPEFGPAPGGCTGEETPNAVYGVANTGDCVKYRCEDGLQVQDEFCTGTQNSWYDYCYGSIIGCVFSCRDKDDGGSEVSSFDRAFYNYWNGWEWDVDCSKAGLWAYNSENESSFGAPAVLNLRGTRLNIPESLNLEYDSHCAPFSGSGCDTFTRLPDARPRRLSESQSRNFRRRSRGVVFGFVGEDAAASGVDSESSIGCKFCTSTDGRAILRGQSTHTHAPVHSWRCLL